jgi:hypothetical protein
MIFNEDFNGIASRFGYSRLDPLYCFPSASVGGSDRPHCLIAAKKITIKILGLPAW